MSTVKGVHGVMEVAKCDTLIFQDEIGEVVKPSKHSVTMVKLASGHNLQDSIVYDRRRKD